MEFEQGLEVIDDAVFVRAGRRLSPVEIAVLRGCWHEDTYDKIAETTGYSIGYLNRTVAPKLWQTLSEAFSEKTGKKNLRFVVERRWRNQGQTQGQTQGQATAPMQNPAIAASPFPAPLPPSPSPSQVSIATSQTPQIDWGEAIDTSFFYGRATELAGLTHWLIEERCRLVALLGMGGIGKTALAVQLAQQLVTVGSPGNDVRRFQAVIWRSLRHAPPLDALLLDLLTFLTAQPDPQPDISTLLQALRQSRCLIILDGVESLLAPGEIGQFRAGYEGYGDLLRVVGETGHQSALVITSREKPAQISVLEGMGSAVRSLRVEGSPDAVRAIVQDKGLQGTTAHRQQLGEFYGNNPLALKIVATSIQELFAGDIKTFLAEETLLLNGIRRLLEQQFQRLTPLEQSIMYWLAVNREWTPLAELHADIVPLVSKARLLEALEALSVRSLIECQTNRYTLQAAVMEYVIEQFTECIAEELKTTELSIFLNHAILKATAPESVRMNQRKFILRAIANQLSKQFGSIAALEQQTLQILTKLRQTADQVAGYGAGNLINLMQQLGLELSHYNFANLTVWQADLRNTPLPYVNFTEADLTNTIFDDDSTGNDATTPPYAGMTITGATGLTPAQREYLKRGGAVESA